MKEPVIQISVDGVDISGEPPYTENVPPINELRGILKAVRIVTECPEGESILTHVYHLNRRYKMFVQTYGRPTP